MTIQEVYAKWKHLNHLLSINPSFSSITSWKDELNYDLWQVVKTEATKESVTLLSDPLFWKTEAERLSELVTVLREQANSWRRIAEQHCRNEWFYSTLLDDCAESLGYEAYVADDGTVMEDPIRLKIPLLVANLTAERRAQSDMRKEAPCPPVSPPRKPRNSLT